MVTTCLSPDLVHTGIMPNFTATSPTLRLSVKTRLSLNTQKQVHRKKISLFTCATHVPPTHAEAKAGPLEGSVWPQ